MWSRHNYAIISPFFSFFYAYSAVGSRTGTGTTGNTPSLRNKSQHLYQILNAHSLQCTRVAALPVGSDYRLNFFLFHSHLARNNHLYACMNKCYNSTAEKSLMGVCCLVKWTLDAWWFLKMRRKTAPSNGLNVRHTFLQFQSHCGSGRLWVTYKDAVLHFKPTTVPYLKNSSDWFSLSS